MLPTIRTIHPMPLIALLFCLAASPSLAQGLRLEAGPGLVAPVEDRTVFGIGAGISARLEAETFGFLSPYLGLWGLSIPPAARDLDSTLSIALGETGLGAFAFPLPRLKLSLSGGVGAYVGSYGRGDGALRTGNLLWRIGAMAGYRINPGLSVMGGVSYLDLLAQTGSLYRGLAFSVSVDLGIGDRGAGMAAVELVDLRSAFPVAAREYLSTPIGSVVVRNAESAEIRDLRVWFFADGFSADKALCGEAPYLARGGKALFDIFADFSDRIMSIAEDTRVSGRILVEYI